MRAAGLPFSLLAAVRPLIYMTTAWYWLLSSAALALVIAECRMSGLALGKVAGIL